MNERFLILSLIILCAVRKSETSKRVNLNIDIIDKNKNKVLKSLVLLRDCNVREGYSYFVSLDGILSLRNICTGTYEIIILNEAFLPRMVKINIYRNMKFRVCMKAQKPNIIHGIIKDNCNKVIETAIVVLYRVLEYGMYWPIRFTYTDFMGEYDFVDVEKGEYIIKAIK